MKWLIASLCVIALAASPAGASANTESEVTSAKPIVVAYLPEYLQHRVPTHHQTRRTTLDLFREPGALQLADAGLSWELRPPEPSTTKQTKQPQFEVEYVSPSPEEATRQERLRRRKIAIGVVVPVVVIGAIAAGIAVGSAMQSMDFY